MRSRLLQSLSSLGFRGPSVAGSSLPGYLSNELSAHRLPELGRCLTTCNPTSLSQTSSRVRCSLPVEVQNQIFQSFHPRQLTHLKTLTTAVSSWQATENEASGINPLMQTPAPASATSVFAPPRADSETERTAQAVLRKQRISPKKLNEFARLIRRKHIDDALVQCQVAPNKAAKLCYKLLLSAKDNAEKDKGLDPDKLRIHKAFVGKGQHMKRMSLHGRARSGTRHVYHSHLTIVLAEGKPNKVTQYRPPLAQWQKHKPSFVPNQPSFVPNTVVQ